MSRLYTGHRPGRWTLTNSFQTFLTAWISSRRGEFDYNFSGRLQVLSNVAGFSALVSRDSGKTLRVVVTVKGSATKPGVKVMTVVFANGARTSFRYSLR